jgi:hypothetical protein
LKFLQMLQGLNKVGCRTQYCLLKEFLILPSTLREGLGEGVTWLNKESNFMAYLFHPHPTSPIKGEELQLNLNSTTFGVKPHPSTFYTAINEKIFYLL